MPLLKSMPPFPPRALEGRTGGLSQDASIPSEDKPHPQDSLPIECQEPGRGLSDAAAIRVYILMPLFSPAGVAVPFPARTARAPPSPRSVPALPRCPNSHIAGVSPLQAARSTRSPHPRSWRELPQPLTRTRQPARK
ncbi:hypothetical protein WOLCODRAFT_155604 [Wolfiporia cocos MD-104 SS10]|uniref:Uncharacterized protein n=1 Tax=Wolfiporia cocos (strain MD-104) TaxID=742152 RepID=A0A2H3JG27_WOLCO|nr:hypothetical protein WOLCODRAFT_155604 [Wolfiporia cocos MD-104 SS10]